MSGNQAASQVGAQDSVLLLSRKFKAPRERVWRAFTEPSALREWWGPEGFTLPKAEVDLRPGGRFAFQMRTNEGDFHNLSGTYKEIKAPERLVLSWVWAEGAMAGVETEVTLEFRTRGDGTELSVRHERFRTRDERDNHDGGWNSSLDRLAKVLAKR
ncbi:MAG TPA: SRPBCC domain-containing protein [Candidatus Cybelea sp.]|nr:SRPBCC domain-containing protein [Candidatus Cybelea sp.]